MLRGLFVIFLVDSEQGELPFIRKERLPGVYSVVGFRSGFQVSDRLSRLVLLKVTVSVPRLGRGTEWGKGRTRDIWLLPSREYWIQQEYLVRSSRS